MEDKLSKEQRDFLDNIMKTLENVPEGYMDTLCLGICHVMVKHHPMFVGYRDGTGTELYEDWCNAPEEEE